MKNDSNLNKRMRRKYAQTAKKLAYLRRRAERGPLTAGQKSRLEAYEVKTRDLRRHAATA